MLISNCIYSSTILALINLMNIKVTTPGQAELTGPFGRVVLGMVILEGCSWLPLTSSAWLSFWKR